MAGSVLVVEDERQIRELLRRYLERAGLPVLTSAGGAEASRMLNEGAAPPSPLDRARPSLASPVRLRAGLPGTVPDLGGVLGAPANQDSAVRRPSVADARQRLPQGFR